MVALREGHNAFPLQTRPNFTSNCFNLKKKGELTSEGIVGAVQLTRW